MAERSASAPKKLVITGVTRGIGRALARRFVALGHRLAGCGQDGGALDTLRSELGPGHPLSRVDVAEAAAVDLWARRVLADFGTPDVLINNAAMINRNAPLWEVPPDELSRLIDVNIKGTGYVIHSFLPAMLDKRRGVVINMSSGWGQTTSPHVAPYCASKFAIEGLTQALAQELPPGMAAIALSPGVIHTDMLETAVGAAAALHPEPDAWAIDAAPYILSLGPQHNGQSLRAAP